MRIDFDSHGRACVLWYPSHKVLGHELAEMEFELFERRARAVHADFPVAERKRSDKNFLRQPGRSGLAQTSDILDAHRGARSEQKNAEDG